MSNSQWTQWIETIRQAVDGFHWHNGQCCTERVLGHRPGTSTMAGRVDWYNSQTGEYREGRNDLKGERI